MDTHRETESMSQLNDELMKPVNDKNELSPVELTNAIICTNLHQMNEDCLLKIFSTQSLNLSDLCSIAETCRLFQQTTQLLVRKAIAVEYDSRKGMFCVDFGKLFLSARDKIERIFINFGTVLSVVKVRGSCGSIDNFLLNQITKHCNDDNLESLTMHVMKIPAVLTIKMKPIFKGLQKLYLDHVEITDDGTLFAELDFLMELGVTWVKNGGAILENTFPKLERFVYEKEIVMDGSIAYPKSQQTFETLSMFMSRNKTLKALQLKVDNCKKIHSFRTGVTHLIVSNCKELKELNLLAGRDTAASHLQPFQTLNSLHTLTLNHFSLNDFRLISPLSQLRELTLCYCNFPIIPDRFTCLTQLRNLSLYTNHEVLDVLAIMTRLTNLEVLEWEYWDQSKNEKISKVLKRKPGCTDIEVFRKVFD